MSSTLQKFLLDEGPDAHGRSRRELMRMSDEELERSHNVVQWLLPTHKPSRRQPQSPVIDEELNLLLATDYVAANTIRRNVELHWQRFLQFWGMTIDPRTGMVIKDPETWNHQSKMWLSPNNHNFLRMTRAVESLFAVGLSTNATYMRRFLINILGTKHTTIVAKSLQFWLGTISSPRPPVWGQHQAKQELNRKFPGN